MLYASSNALSTTLEMALFWDAVTELQAWRQLSPLADALRDTSQHRAEGENKDARTLRVSKLGP